MSKSTGQNNFRCFFQALKCYDVICTQHFANSMPTKSCVRQFATSCVRIQSHISPLPRSVFAHIFHTIPSPTLMYSEYCFAPYRDCPVAAEWKTIRMRTGLDLQSRHACRRIRLGL
jgi:hypothetical protein